MFPEESRARAGKRNPSDPSDHFNFWFNVSAGILIWKKNASWLESMPCLTGHEVWQLADPHATHAVLASTVINVNGGWDSPEVIPPGLPGWLTVLGALYTHPVAMVVGEAPALNVPAVAVLGVKVSIVSVSATLPPPCCSPTREIKYPGAVSPFDAFRSRMGIAS